MGSAFALGAVARDAEAHTASASHATQGMPSIRRRPKWQCSSSTIIRAGLGGLLVTRLVAEARSRGIERLHALVLPDNDVVIAMLAKFATPIAVERYGDELRADIPTWPAGYATPAHASA